MGNNKFFKKIFEERREELREKWNELNRMNPSYSISSDYEVARENL